MSLKKFINSLKQHNLCKLSSDFFKNSEMNFCWEHITE
ncbi:hypothetical protein LEP1GSC012_3241 [Leptospira interrogans serovar Valbuzzi str. Valbuzzi]|nr:hypothetical protein LEP1GSC012_3241 [Leptospira interrogans serovar Valbuzzi str. Valbuzzi]